MADLKIFKKRVLARLGSFTFELRSLAPDRIEREFSYRWTKQEPIGTHPIRQFLGVDSQKITLSGSAYPGFTGGLRPLKNIRDLADSGEPQRLIYADTALGQNLGLWIILAIRETRTLLLSDGLPQRIDFTLELESYEKPPAL